ncbi:C2 domain-containing protein [Cokeromyces recurvatus]|uniref:C2 domain-containing protein n=1 Tax=Cokeromyces recurvatus TaxID=90255 RepID=UPI00222031DA|nr:C2 domain-containing protein [Cokeromyces recurvatus]KAI7900877.1 C2 domain-containing protein [Cokeromyces recurvatus]
MAYPPSLITGELVVVALKAEKLQHKAPGKQSPFCIFRVGDVIKRTKTDEGGGLYPIWDDQVNIPVSAGHHQLHIQIFDRDNNNPNNLMAEGIVDLQKVFRDKEHDDYFPLNLHNRPSTGVIYLELTFYAAVNQSRPPPIQQQVRYQYPPGSTGGAHCRPQQQQRPPNHYNRPSMRPMPPPPPQHVSSVSHQYGRPVPSPQQHMSPAPQQFSRPIMHQPSYNSRPPLHVVSSSQSPYRPLPQPPITNNRPSVMMSPPPPPPPQAFPQPMYVNPSQTMSASRPLLSAPYNPAPSPIITRPRPMDPNGYPPPPPPNRQQPHPSQNTVRYFPPSMNYYPSQNSHSYPPY